MIFINLPLSSLSLTPNLLQRYCPGDFVYVVSALLNH